MSAAVNRAASVARPRPLLAGCLLVLLVLQSVWFGYRTLAALARLEGDRAYYAGEHDAAWRQYERAARLGGSTEALALDQAELLLNGIDMKNLGVRVSLPFSVDDALDNAERLIARLLAASPSRAYYWSLAADLYLNRGQAHRRTTPLDLSTIAEDPRENLRPEEILAVAALEAAARREPQNYIYEDILAEQLLQWGLDDLAVAHVRRGVALYPVLGSHIHLNRPRLPPAIADAAVLGFEDARAAVSMVSADVIECDAGKFLLGQGRNADAVRYLERALEINPRMADALGQMGVAKFLNGEYASAISYLERATVELPESAYLWFHMGRSRIAMGDRVRAREDLRRAREADPRNLQLFHAYAELLEAEGAIKDAERQFQAAASNNPTQNAAWRALLAFYARHPEIRGGTRQVCARLEHLKSARGVFEESCGRREAVSR